MSDILTKIEAYKREEIAAAKRVYPLAQRRALARQPRRPRGFVRSDPRKAAHGEYALIAEVKKLRLESLTAPDFDPPALARAYEAAALACLSVLTDTPSFQAISISWRPPARHRPAGAAQGISCTNTYQVVEARRPRRRLHPDHHGALDDAAAKDIEDAALAHGMDVLIEIHERAELDRALKLRSPMIGVNNRNLRTFETTLATSEALAPLIPRDRLMVGESGNLRTGRSGAACAGSGCRRFLVGESLMRQADVAAATRALLARGDAISAAGTR